MQRLRTARGNLHELVLLQFVARGVPERLPVRRLHETVLRARLFKTGDRHVAKALEHRLDELARLLPQHPRHAFGIGGGLHEDVVFRRDHKRLARRVERHLMPGLVLEVHGDLAVEIVAVLDRSEAPRRAQNARAFLERHQPVKPPERLGERTHAKADGLHKRKKKAVLCRLLQDFPHANSLGSRLQCILVVLDDLQRAHEILRFRLELQLSCQVFRLLICHRISYPC